MVLRCAIGTLTFEKSVIKSHARLIRDNLMGVILCRREGDPLVDTEEDCYKYIMEQCDNVLARVPFRIVRS